MHVVGAHELILKLPDSHWKEIALDSLDNFLASVHSACERAVVEEIGSDFI